MQVVRLAFAGVKARLRPPIHNGRRTAETTCQRSYFPGTAFR